MKKTFKLLAMAVITFCTAQSISAQEFDQGTNVINAGIGFGGNFNYGGIGTSSQGLGLSASYERGIWETGDFGIVSLGAYLGYKSYTSKTVFGGSRYDFNYTIIGARGAFHYIGLDVENLDVYGGAMLSLNIASYDGNFDNDLSTRPSGTIFVGGRYYFTDSIGVFAEAGYGVSFLTIGAAFRF
ncbi:hypothetical protein RQM65_02650 [Pricia sp. S334]|uniref:Outer membrane protein beta-barrel domain-containing protein n=1 Tax=Pricia mediterranea TaxID=3076079 RepID=A0ABU3L2D8_9FLAO|nr:hypothetical protein [Pricia sp. S334]MDT7827563.1 hypothetical protein [Pricia sp. S334]